MIESKKILINNTNYEITPFPGMQGWKIQLKLGKVLSPAFKSILENENFLESKASNLGLILKDFLEQLYNFDPNGDFVLELLSKTQRENMLVTRGLFDQVYSANYTELAKVLWEVIKTNGFFQLNDIGNLN